MKLKRVRIRYPWITPLTGLSVALYYYLGSNDALRGYYGLQERYFHPDYQLAALVLLCLLVVTELLLFSRRRNRYNALQLKHEEQIHDLIHKKNQLHQKAHTYSDHADKLKLFISERLLEHIEYDEKFLHFKNIASEVRHNGVICYDKVITSLERAISHAKREDSEKYDEAIQSMIYLWDLLDLSTTDNISMYIANKLYESEERYYQQLLKDDGETHPSAPLFDFRHAVLKAIHRFDSGDDEFQGKVEKGITYHDTNGRFLLSLESALNLLGNENHIVLVAENLINNALYYANMKRYRSPYTRIAVRLVKDGKRGRLSIYNRGPLIEEENRGQLFKLGFSTKRAKNHNGKGLGLYFSHEIVKGFEGEIDYENVTNREDTYVVRIETADGEVQSRIIKTVLNSDGVLECQEDGADDIQKKVEISVDAKVESVEITSRAHQKPHTTEHSKSRKTTVILGCEQPEYPLWALTIKPAKANTRILFEPLDIRGVRFDVALPLAESRIDADYHEVDDHELSDIDELNKAFKDNREYVA